MFLRIIAMKFNPSFQFLCSQILESPKSSLNDAWSSFVACPVGFPTKIPAITAITSIATNIQVLPLINIKEDEGF